MPFAQGAYLAGHLHFPIDKASAGGAGNIKAIVRATLALIKPGLNCFGRNKVIAEGVEDGGEEGHGLDKVGFNV